MSKAPQFLWGFLTLAANSMKSEITVLQSGPQVATVAVFHPLSQPKAEGATSTPSTR